MIFNKGQQGAMTVKVALQATRLNSVPDRLVSLMQSMMSRVTDRLSHRLCMIKCKMENKNQINGSQKNKIKP